MICLRGCCVVVAGDVLWRLGEQGDAGREAGERSGCPTVRLSIWGVWGS